MKAFTLVELLISISIIAFMATMSITAYPKFSEQISLTAETYKMLAYFRETQTYGVSAVATPGTKFVYAFLVDKSTGKISRVQIENPTGKTNQYYITQSATDILAKESLLKSNYEIYEINGITNTGTTSLDKAYGFFKRPNPEARLAGLVGNNISPDAAETSFSKFEITLRSKRNTQFMKKIVILSTGQMYVSDW